MLKVCVGLQVLNLLDTIGDQASEKAELQHVSFLA